MEYKNAVDALLAVSPHLVDQDAVTVADWGNGDGPVPEIHRVGELGSAFASLVNDMSDREKTGIALVVEQFMNADQHSRDVMGTGFIEAVVAEIENGRASLDDVAPVLGPRSKEYLLAWGDFECGDA